ncbi:MAG: hypothetical protein U1A07_04825, partial [Phenylobacterium sp.]|nr:hypothetical protein [Phenylobacterium sp.]
MGIERLIEETEATRATAQPKLLGDQMHNQELILNVERDQPLSPIGVDLVDAGNGLLRWEP